MFVPDSDYSYNKKKLVDGRPAPLLSGLILWTWCMALILLMPKRFTTIWTRMRINAMRHYN
ncbi:MAG: hypothetical protein ACFCUQ_13085, partial [Kiloniellales bacterium]